MSPKADQFAFDAGAFRLYESLVADLHDDSLAASWLLPLLDSPDRNKNKAPNLLFIQSLRDLCVSLHSIRAAVFRVLHSYISREVDTAVLVDSIFPTSLWFHDFLLSTSDIIPFLSVLESGA
jgi:hypothetical protein